MPEPAPDKSKESMLAMRQPAVQSLPRSTSFGWCGLGWYLADLPDGRILALNGSTIGLYAFLRAAPDTGVAVALLSNGGDGLRLARELVVPVFEELTGTRLVEHRVPTPEPAPVPHPDRYVGQYRNRVCDAEVRADSDGPPMAHAAVTTRGVEPADLLAGVEWSHYRRAPPGRGEEFAIALPGGGMGAPCAFLGSDHAGRAELLHKGTALPRVG